MISSIEMGGAESQIASLVNYLKEDYDVSLITFKNKNRFLQNK